MGNANPTHIDLQAIAKKIMIERGFRPDFPPEVQPQLAALRNRPPKMAAEGDVRDLRNLLWSSIDNDTSRDLDQVEVAERLPDGGVRIMIGIADVDAFVPKLTPTTWTLMMTALSRLVVLELALKCRFPRQKR